MPKQGDEANSPAQPMRARRTSDGPRGLLDLASGRRHFRLSRYHASDELSFFVEHFWIVEWELPENRTFQQQSLPHPSVHIAVERGRAEVVGITRGKFVRVLQGRGRVFGIKFCPGAFHPFVRVPVSQFTNRAVPVSKVFGRAGTRFADAVIADPDADRNVALAQEFLCLLRAPRDENVPLVKGIVEQVAADRNINKVDDLAAVALISKRALQRLFARYVGVSPKWVIQRYRLLEAVESIKQGETMDWAKLAVDLGYFDQAHFITCFKRFVGQTPDDYARSLGTGTTAEAATNVSSDNLRRSPL